MFKTLIKYLQLGLDLLKADPAEKEQIAALQVQVTTLNAELAQARTQSPSPEETEQIKALLNQFAEAEAVKPRPPVTLEGVVPVPVPEVETAGEVVRVTLPTDIPSMEKAPVDSSTPEQDAPATDQEAPEATE